MVANTFSIDAASSTLQQQLSACAPEQLSATDLSALRSLHESIGAILSSGDSAPPALDAVHDTPPVTQNIIPASIQPMLQQFNIDASDKDTVIAWLSHVLDSLPGFFFMKGLGLESVYANDNLLSYIDISTNEDLANIKDGDYFYDKNTFAAILNNDQSVLCSCEEHVFVEGGLDARADSNKYLACKKPLYATDGSLLGLIGLAMPFANADAVGGAIEKQALVGRIQKYRSELAYLNKIIDLVPGNLYWKNRRGVYLGCNSGTVILTQASGKSDIVGKSLQEIYKNTDMSSIEAADFTVMQDNKVFSAVEEVFLAGVKKYYLTTKVPMLSSGAVIGMIGLSFDITKQKELESHLRLTAKERDEANMLREEMMANMSHDLRTPCAGILGLTEIMLLRGGHDAAALEDIKDIQLAAARLMRIMGNVIFSGYKSYHEKISAFCLRDIVASIEAMLKPKLRASSTVLQITNDSCLDAVLSSYKNKIQHVLLNIITNAVKFSDGGLVVCAFRVDRHKVDSVATLHVSIKDDGPGILPENIASIFEPYKRLSAAHAEQVEGSGLGLYIVKKLMDEMHASIRVVSEAGQGACFLLEFPLEAVADQESSRTVDCNAVDEAPSFYCFRQRDKLPIAARLLLVEDDPVAARVATALLANYSVKLTHVTSLRDADQQDLNTFDAIWVDNGLPDGSGFAWVAECVGSGRLSSKVVKVGMSAHYMPGDKPAGGLLEQEALDSILVKPVSRDFCRDMFY